MPMRRASGWPLARRAGHRVAHVQRHLGHRLGVVGPRLGQPAGDHVGVADGLDLLQPVALGEPVEAREQLVEGRTTCAGGSLAAAGEAHHVGEQHRDVGEPVGDHRLAGFEPLGDRCGQDVEQQPLGSLLLQRQRAAPADRLPQQQHGDEQGRVDRASLSTVSGASLLA